MRRKPKFKIGERVTYREDRRWRMVITGCYWDPDLPVVAVSLLHAADEKRLAGRVGTNRSAVAQAAEKAAAP